MRDLSATSSIEGFARGLGSKGRLESIMAVTNGLLFYNPAVGKQYHSVIVLE